ncbi:glycerate dehydrogenase [Longispora fulva]|uniref:Phosphoglycerate dehydrogenase-like enzyme n=1 Tax=Longispora fulva TaxID=619741 RepID=A0A8J7KN86_9ACTN|nr:hydroxyacid dehydrogenase [Longispora fulva]MBG6134952.1 phosphoglycerate dehydrogenase-like enzyme [Longispora fulva]GIG56816.1 glycerate dehydrogenase [Longispora fulva]
MSDHPAVVLALPPDLVGDLLPADLRARLDRTATWDPAVNLQAGPAPAALARAEVLLTGWGCPTIDAEFLAGAPRLRAVVHAAGSVKGHVTDAVYAAGILVSSAAEANARPVAEYTLAALVLAAKRAFGAARDLRNGHDGHRHAPGEATGLTGCVVGVVGASRVGRLVIAMLADYGVEVLVADPYADPAEFRAAPPGGGGAAGGGGATLVDLDTLCRRSDIVTVHAPSLPETHHLLDARRLDLLRDGAVVINTARGALIDTAALTRHCAAGRLDAVLDVTDPEPLPLDHPLLVLPNVLVTPHIAGVRGRELRLLGAYAVADIERYAAGLPLRGAVRHADLARMA